MPKQLHQPRRIDGLERRLERRVRTHERPVERPAIPAGPDDPAEIDGGLAVWSETHYFVLIAVGEAQIVGHERVEKPERVLGRQLLHDADSVRSGGIREHPASAVACRVDRQAQRFAEAGAIEGRGQVRHVVMDSLDSGTGTEVVTQVVTNPLDEQVVGDGRRDDQVDILEPDVRYPEAGLDGVIGKAAIRRFDPEIPLFLAGGHDPSVDGQHRRWLVLADGNPAVKPEHNHRRSPAAAPRSMCGLTDR